MIEEIFIEPVQDNVKQVEQLMRAGCEGYHPAFSAALNHLLASGGKRIRVVVALLTGAMLGADQQRLITLAAAIESLHTATLVHDDLIDGALLRRGIPTLNAQWSPAATVLTGDFIFARAAKLAAETDSLIGMRMFSETLATIVNGEITQMFNGRGVVERENYYQRIYAKTASLFELAAHAPAILSEAEPEVALKVKQYGYEIGMAFQIVDDVLDFTGKQAVLGKPVASDLRQGLVTLPSLYYLEAHADDADFHSIIEGNFCGEECINRLVDAIRHSGAIEQSLQEAHQYVARGLEALDGFAESREREALAALAKYIIARDI
ncbi:MAG: polyprenyl synthetase family protein [Anaerolineales bacterium]|nr:polyprenyl synthetase family protein [Anaerolineales bacterium]